MLAGVVVATKLGVQATVLYLIVYLVMNMAAFAVIVARERETGLGDSIGAVTGLGRERPLLAWPLTLSMLGLAGLPATAGLIGKVYLIEAAVEGGYAWLGIVIVIGSMISLAYYLPVIAAMWMRDAPGPAPLPAPRPEGPGGLPAVAGGSSELDDDRGLRAGAQPAVRGRSWSRCSPARRRSSSGSCRSRCSTSCETRARRSGCCRPPPRSASAGLAASRYSRPDCSAASSAWASWRSTRSRPASQKPGSARSMPTIAATSSGLFEPPAASISR